MSFQAYAIASATHRFFVHTEDVHMKLRLIYTGVNRVKVKKGTLSRP